MEVDDALSSPEEDNEVAETEHAPTPRSLKSLALIAARFVDLIHKSEGGKLDLKEAVTVLAVPQKRRIYDITNVLEGIGVIEKITKNVVQWKGVLPGENALNSGRRNMLLKCELQELAEKEDMLDQQLDWIRQSIKNIYEDRGELSYVNQEDICNSFKGHTVLAVQAPSGTQLDVPIPKAIRDSPTTYQVHLKSSNGPIKVLLLNKRSCSAEAVALPPSKDVLHRARLALGNLTEKQIHSLSCLPAENTCQKNVRTLQTLFQEIESNKTGLSGFHCLSKNIKDLLDPTKEMNAEINPLKENELFKMTPDVISLSPPPLDDYRWDLDESEGVCDLFDVPMLNV